MDRERDWEMKNKKIRRLKKRYERNADIRRLVQVSAIFSTDFTMFRQPFAALRGFI